MKKRMMYGLWLMLLLVACGSTELEGRCFPLIAVVSEDEGAVGYWLSFPKESNMDLTAATASNFQEGQSRFEGRCEREVDYNHLKVLVLEEDFLQNKSQYDTMLDQLARQEQFPRNTLVCVVDDVEELMKLEKNISQDLGTYLETYLKQHQQVEGYLPTLGDLLNGKANESSVFALPYLEVEKNYLEWNGYMNTIGEIWQDSVIQEQED